MKTRIYVIVTLFGAVLLLTGCSATISTGSPQYREAVVIRHDKPPKLGIPRGHLPSPGSCRIWLPGRPPGQQPAATYCADAVKYAPAGSWVIYRPAYDRRNVYVRVIDSRRHGVVTEVHVFTVRRGTYVRTEMPSRARYRR